MMKFKKSALTLFAAAMLAGSVSPILAYDSGWQKTQDNLWWYLNEDGHYPTNKWQKIDGKWYWFNQDGFMVKGWKKVGDQWYFLTDDGTMKTGWLKQDGKWYLFDSAGVLQKGWRMSNGNHYYFDSAGVMKTGWMTKDGKSYYLREDGVLAKDTWIGSYYVNKDGEWVKDAKPVSQDEQIVKDVQRAIKTVNDRPATPGATNTGPTPSTLVYEIVYQDDPDHQTMSDKYEGILFYKNEYGYPKPLPRMLEYMEKAGLNVKAAAQKSADIWKEQLTYWYGQGGPLSSNMHDTMVKDLQDMGWTDDIIAGLYF